MDTPFHQTALLTLTIGLAMVGTAVWLERRRKHRVMPSLIPPMPLLFLGGTIALISAIVLLVPSDGVPPGVAPPRRMR